MLSPMTGLDISSGLSLLVKRRKIDVFLNSGDGWEVSTATMMSMCIDPTFPLDTAALVQVQASMVQVQANMVRIQALSALAGVEEARNRS